MQPDGFQYCVGCGQASIPLCAHKWQEKEYSNIMAEHLGGKREVGTYAVLKCTVCGDLKEFKAHV